MPAPTFEVVTGERVDLGEPAPPPSDSASERPQGNSTAPAAGEQADGEGDGAGDAEGLAIPVSVVQMGVEAAFAYAAAVRGEHWRIEPEEAERIAEPAAQELSDLADRVPFLHGAADAVGERRLRLVLALGMAIGPRYWTDKQNERARASAARVTPFPRPEPEPASEPPGAEPAGDPFDVWGGPGGPAS